MKVMKNENKDLKVAIDEGKIDQVSRSRNKRTRQHRTRNQ